MVSRRRTKWQRLSWLYVHVHGLPASTPNGLDKPVTGKKPPHRIRKGLASIQEIPGRGKFSETFPAFFSHSSWRRNSRNRLTVHWKLKRKKNCEKRKCQATHLRGAASTSPGTFVMSKPSARLSELYPLRFYVHDGSASFRIELIGDIHAKDIGELEGCWRTARSSISQKPVVLDLRGLTGVSEEGHHWLTSMYQQGVSLLAESAFSRKIAEELTGAPWPVSLQSNTSLFSRIKGRLRRSLGCSDPFNSAENSSSF